MISGLKPTPDDQTQELISKSYHAGYLDGSTRGYLQGRRAIGSPEFVSCAIICASIGLCAYLIAPILL